MEVFTGEDKNLNALLFGINLSTVTLPEIEPITAPILAVSSALDFKVKNPPVVNTPAVGVSTPIKFNAPVKLTPAALLMVKFLTVAPLALSV